jgi:hypothetical protein
LQQTELKITYVIFLIDTCPDSGYVSQMKPVGYAEEEFYAQGIVDYFNSNDNDDPNRKYHYKKL